MRAEAELLAAIEREPGDELAWLALADCLEENGEERRAELVRLREWLRFADLNDPQRPRSEARLQALLEAGVKPAGPRLRLFLSGSVPFFEFALIPPGVFWMGSSRDEPERYDDEGPRHRVQLTKGFWMGVHPVTQEQWRAVRGEYCGEFTSEHCPVDQASWHECQEFCARLSQRIGRGVRLPTEAEWEYACRAGTTTPFSSGPDESALARAGWYAANSHGLIQPVGQKQPNAWGLHDMHGVVWEWCSDNLRPYAAAESVDPIGAEGGMRVVRGGSRQNEPRATRCAHRGVDSLDSHLGPLGCRLVLPLE